MADLSRKGINIEQPRPAFCCSARNQNFHLDFLGFNDEIFNHLLTLTSNLTCRLIHFIKNLVCNDIAWCLEDLLCSGLDASCTNQSIHDAITETCSSKNIKLEPPVNRRSETVTDRYGSWCVSTIFQGLTLPIFCLRLFWRMAWTSFKSSFDYVTEIPVSFISRVQKTLLGSSDDIGWLQRTPGAAPVVDRTDRYLELLEAIKNGNHNLPHSFVYLLIPGLFSNHGPLYFVTTKRCFSKMGLTCHIAKIHSEASVEHNALVLKQYVEELYWGSGKRVMLLGHSKGGVDAAAALSLYWDHLKNKVAGLAFVQSPYGGTPIASDILRQGQIADKETRRIMEFVICKLFKGDIRALEDLTYDRRKEFISKHELPEELPLVSFHSEARISPGVLSTLTHIAHAELPWIRFPGLGSDPVPVLAPVSAAMAVCALHLRLRYGEKSDGLVTCRDAEVPGSVLVKPSQKIDHSFMVFASSSSSSFSSSDKAEADASEMCEALLALLVEIRKKKDEERQNNMSLMK